MESRIQQFQSVQKEAFDLFSKKNADYGDAFAKDGPVGVLVRLGDKVQRMKSIQKSGITLVQDESLRDTLVDLSNYAVLCVMLLDEKE